MKIGVLKLRSDGRYGLYDGKGREVDYFTSGSLIEVKFGARYTKGRVEHSNNYGGYYFYDSENGHRELREGLRARVED